MVFISDVKLGDFICKKAIIFLIIAAHWKTLCISTVTIDEHLQQKRFLNKHFKAGENVKDFMLVYRKTIDTISSVVLGPNALKIFWRHIAIWSQLSIHIKKILIIVWFATNKLSFRLLVYQKKALLSIQFVCIKIWFSWECMTHTKADQNSIFFSLSNLSPSQLLVIKTFQKQYMNLLFTPLK